MEENAQLKLAYDFIQYTNRHVFLTGKAGTGKTTFLHQLKKQLPKRMVVVAPTGVAAINAGGVTIHSFFQMPFGPIIPSDVAAEGQNISNKRIDSNVKKFNRQKINIIRSLDLLVIDEISMVRADLLDGIDEVLRRFKNPNQPFGGVQLLMIGDMQQLPPVIKDEEWNLLRNYYSTGFFFGSRALQRSNYISIELQHIYRQSDQTFIQILNEIRESNLSQQSLLTLNKRYMPDFDPPSKAGYITLTTHNSRANAINLQKINQLKGTSRRFKAVVADDFPEYTYPTDYNLELKNGAQVMFVKNDPSPEKQFYNGKIGIITGFDRDIIHVKCAGDDESIAVEPALWHNIKYAIDDSTKEISESIAGTFKQHPLRLAWAITIHKSQGLTFEKAIIDAHAAFAHGQTYVALSRCKSMEGLVLSSQINEQGIICDQNVANFNADIHQNQPNQSTLVQSKLTYEYSLLNELFTYDDIYRSLNRVDKSVYENQQFLLGNSLAQLATIKSQLQPHIIEISVKFQQQLIQLIRLSTTLEHNHQLQERVRKAVAYFGEKTKAILMDPLNALSFSTDNKTIRKTITERLKELKEKTAIKLVCLEACLEGFETKTYLTARAKASISPLKNTKTSSDQPEIDTVKYPELFKQLREWRKETADEMKKPVFWVASQKVLVQIVNQLPTNFTDLQYIKGIGKKKVEDFGSKILFIVNKYKETHPDQISNEEDTLSEIVILDEAEPKKKSKQPTREISFELYQKGHSIESIAKRRSLKTTTVEDHLSQFVETGDLPVEQFVSKDKINQILEFFDKNHTLKINDAKHHFGSQVSFSDLKFVQKHMLYLKDED